MGEFNPQRQITRSTLRRSSLELALGRESGATCTPARGRSTTHGGCEVGGAAARLSEGVRSCRGRHGVLLCPDDATQQQVRCDYFHEFSFISIYSAQLELEVGNLQQAADVKTQASLHVSCTCLHVRATNTPKVHGCITGLQKEDTILVTSNLNLLPYSTT